MNIAKHCVLNKIDGKFFATGYFRRLFSKSNAAASTNTEQEEVIEIPNRIERGPTDILKALASTVGTDYTAPHYRYQDDPWLVPYTHNDKREFWMAKESGRNAARFIAARHPHLFEKNRIRHEPPITAFQPRATLNIDNVSIELLQNYIENLQVEDAITVYNLLKEKKKKLSKEIQQDLLELLSFNAEGEELTKENATSRGMMFTKKAWATGGLAENLYSHLETAEARLAMLLGLAKYAQFARAAQMWKEIEANKDPKPIEAYNAIISVHTGGDIDSFKAGLVGYLTEMREANLHPNDDTLVACLVSISRLCSTLKRNFNECRELALSVISEFKNIGLEPSLGTYFRLLEVYYTRDAKDKSMILRDIMDQLQDKDLWPAKTMDDFNFFMKAMHAAVILNQVKLAYSIDSLLHTGNNINLLSDNYSSEKYHSFLLTLVLMNDDLEVAWNLYTKLSPHVCSPRPEFFESMLMHISSKGAVQYIGKLYDDMEVGNWGQSSKEMIYALNSMVLKILDSNPSSQSEFTNLSHTYADIAYRIFTNLNENKASKALYLRFNTYAAGICSYTMTILLTEGEYEKAREVFEFCLEEKERMPGQLTEPALILFLESVILDQDIETGILVVDYLLSINSSKALECATNLAKLNLTNSQKKILNKYFSHEQNWKNLATS